VVDGKQMNACLGDTFSVSWMENADVAGGNETLGAQYQIVARETTRSLVSQYGDLSWLDLDIDDFQGNDPSLNLRDLATGTGGSGRFEFGGFGTGTGGGGRLATGVAQGDAHLMSLYWRYLRASSSVAQADVTRDLLNELLGRGGTDVFFVRLATRLAAENDQGATFVERLLRQAPTAAAVAACQAKGGCCRSMYELIRRCRGWSEHALRYTRTIVNLCTHTDPERLPALHSAAQRFCRFSYQL
jgi:hypothetical protein